MIDCLYSSFKHWAKTGSVYIISDTHFDDSDCKLMDSNWISPQEHIAILKKKLHKGDTLIHLGDVGNPEYLKELRCYKVLIMGNHDKGKSNYLRKRTYIGLNESGENIIYDNHLFDEVYEGPVMIAEKLMLSHEPLNMGEYWFNIHGHNHNSDNCWESFNGLNLASNVIGYIPISLGGLIKDGILKDVNGLHRQTIDYATLRKDNKND